MDPKNINFAAMPQTAINVVTKPADFFQDMPRTGGYFEPLVFAVIMGVISGVISAILSLFGLGQTGGVSGFGMIIFMPIAAAVGSFVGGAILFIIWKLMGSSEDYEAAYRCCAYLMALSPITAIIGAVPYAGTIINTAIMVFYLVMASIHVHGLEAKKAWLVFGIIGVILAIMTVWGQYKARNAMSEWQKMGAGIQKEYGKSAEEMQQAADDLRQQAEEMAKKYKQQQEESK